MNSLDSTVSNASIALSRLNPISDSLSIDSSLGAKGSAGSASPSSFCPSKTFKDERILLALSFELDRGLLDPPNPLLSSGGKTGFPPSSKLNINYPV